VAEYKKEQITLGRLLFDQVVATRDPVYFRAAAGMLETMFGGVDAEVAVPLWNGRILAGASGGVVRKRAANDPFRFRGNDNYHTSLLQGRLNVPEIDAAIDVKWGRFLAGDRGVRVAVSKFVRGVTLSAWYSATDTDVFTDPFNRGYHDKGISAEIPIHLFTGRDSRTAYRYSLSPWTRDVAQDIDRHLPLFDRIGLPRGRGRNLGNVAEKNGRAGSHPAPGGRHRGGRGRRCGGKESRERPLRRDDRLDRLGGRRGHRGRGRRWRRRGGRVDNPSSPLTGSARAPSIESHTVPSCRCRSLFLVDFQRYACIHRPPGRPPRGSRNP